MLRSLALLMREVMAGSVLLPTMDFMADPVSAAALCCPLLAWLVMNATIDYCCVPTTPKIVQNRNFA